MRKNIRIVTIVTFLFALCACNGDKDEKALMDRQSRKALLRKDSMALKIATVPTMDCLPLFVGVEDSLFKKHGVDVRLKRRNAQLDCDTLMFGCHVEGCVSDLIRMERLRSQGMALSYIAATDAYWKFISNRKVRVKEIKQLSDKMVAMTRYSATEYLADLAIDSAKPKHDVFRVQINDVNIRLRMLLNNEMDAMMLTEPQATTALLYKHPVLMDSREKDLRLGVIAFREAILQDKFRKEQLKKFVKAYNEICDSINLNGVQRYASVISKYMGADEKTIKALPKLKYSHAVPPRQKDLDMARKKWK